MPWSEINPAKALPWAEARTGLTLADSQAEAVRLPLRSKTTVITGGPGVGKTTIVKTILRILQAKAVTLRLCAPTGRAAKRMSEATGMEAKTIHRLLEVDPKTFGFRRHEDNPLKCDLLVVDESSMVDVLLMQALLQAVPDQTRSQGVHSAAWTRPRRHTRHRALNPNGPEAAAYTTARLTGAYGRILRYVILASGENFNATPIRNGYARGAWDIRSRRWPLQRAWGWY